MQTEWNYYSVHIELKQQCPITPEQARYVERCTGFADREHLNTYHLTAKGHNTCYIAYSMEEAISLANQVNLQLSLKRHSRHNRKEKHHANEKSSHR